MNVLDTEIKIIKRLEEKVNSLKVEGYPDDPAGYILKHKNGALLVRYQRSVYSEPRSATVDQKQTCEFDITIITKNLRTNTGAYTYLEIVKSALTGHRINLQLNPALAPDYVRLYPVRDGFILENKGVWYYGITFALNTIHEEDE